MRPLSLLLLAGVVATSCAVGLRGTDRCMSVHIDDFNAFIEAQQRATMAKKFPKFFQKGIDMVEKGMSDANALFKKMNAEAKRQAAARKAAGIKDPVKIGSFALTRADGVPSGFVASQTLCLSVKIPLIVGVDLNIMVHGNLKTSTWTKTIDSTVEVSCAVGFGVFKASFGIKGALELTGENCNSWGSVLKSWAAGVVGRSLETNEVKEFAKGNEAALADLAKLVKKVADERERLRAEYRAASKAGDSKKKGQSMGRLVVAEKVVKALREEQTFRESGVCTVSWMATLAVTAAAGAAGTCNDTPLLLAEAAYSWGATFDEEGNPVDKKSEGAAVVTFQPIDAFALSAGVGSDSRTFSVTVTLDASAEPLDQVFDVFASDSADFGLEGQQKIAKALAPALGSLAKDGLKAGATALTGNALVVEALFFAGDVFADATDDVSGEKASVQAVVEKAAGSVLKNLKLQLSDFVGKKKKDMEDKVKAIVIEEKSSLIFTLAFNWAKNEEGAWVKTFTTTLSAEAETTPSKGFKKALGDRIDGHFKAGLLLDLSADAFHDTLWSALKGGFVKGASKLKAGLTGEGSDTDEESKKSDVDEESKKSEAGAKKTVRKKL